MCSAEVEGPPRPPAGPISAVLILVWARGLFPQRGPLADLSSSQPGQAWPGACGREGQPGLSWAPPCAPGLRPQLLRVLAEFSAKPPSEGLRNPMRKPQCVGQDSIATDCPRPHWAMLAEVPSWVAFLPDPLAYVH